VRHRDVAENPAILLGNVAVEKRPDMIPAEGLALFDEKEFKIRPALGQRKRA
jgi:hypothetical protein